MKVRHWRWVPRSTSWRIFSGRLAYTYRIIELVENTRLVMRAAEGPFPMETRYEFAEIEPGKTLVRLRNRGRPAGFAAIVAPFMAAAMRSANRRDLAALKALLEQDGAR